MQRTLRYWTGGPTEEAVWRRIHEFANELGHPLVDAAVKPCGPDFGPGGFNAETSSLHL